jgi:hypothetical protein
MRAGTIRRTRVTGVRQELHLLTHGLRLRYLPTKHGHAARLGLARATREYQSDSSSKRPAPSAISDPDSPKTTRPPPTRERREALTRVIPYQFRTRGDRGPTMKETWQSILPVERRHRGRFPIGARSPDISWTRSPASTPNCRHGRASPRSTISSIRRLRAPRRRSHHDQGRKPWK